MRERGWRCLGWLLNKEPVSDFMPIIKHRAEDFCCPSLGKCAPFIGPPPCGLGSFAFDNRPSG
ncbi:hypothetical protein SBV1_450003 [Verrucomicrobia bacterium]|nr:hypothetical protein SBV1_450003 [Verrucomicrobiota bacterium]